MPKVKFWNGVIVNFDKTPTPEEVKEVATKLKIPQKPAQQEPSIGQNIKSDLSKRAESIGQSLVSGKTGLAGLGETLNIAGQTAGGVLDVIGNVVGPTVSSIADKGTTALSKVVSGTPTKFETGVLNAIKGGVETWNVIKQEHPDIARAVENVVNIGSVVPVAQGISSVAKGATTLAKASTGALSSIAKPAIKTVGTGLEKAGEAIYKSAIPLSKSEAGSLQAFKAGTRLEKPLLTGQTALEKGFMGTESMIGVQAAKEASTLWSETVKPALSKIKETIKTKEVLRSMENKIKETIKEPVRQKDLLDGVKALRVAYWKFPEMTHQFAQDIKSSLYKFIPDKVLKGKPVSSVSTEVKAMFAKELRALTRKALSGNNKALKAFDDYGNLKNLMEFGQTAMTGSKFKGGLGSWINAAKEKLLVPAQTVGGKLINEAGKLLNK